METDRNPDRNPDPGLDITIFGQPVLDHVIKLDDPLRYGGLMNICSIDPVTGEMLFDENSYIRTIENEEPYFFDVSKLRLPLG